MSSVYYFDDINTYILTMSSVYYLGQGVYITIYIANKLDNYLNSIYIQYLTGFSTSSYLMCTMQKLEFKYE